MADRDPMLTARLKRDEIVRRSTLIEAYWTLRDHASGLRDSNVYQRARERAREARGRRLDGVAQAADRQAELTYSGLRWNASGIDAAAADIAGLLGVDEDEIERPAGTPEVDR